MLQGLYVITDGSVGDVLYSKVEQALIGGAAIVQFRDKTLEVEQRKQDALVLRTLCHEYNAIFIVNDDMALARTVQADGVHVGKDDVALAAAREYLGKNTLIGVSCYNRLELAQDAVARGADYVAFGSFFPSPTKPEAVRAMPELLLAAKNQLSTPVCAIGGITLGTAPLLRASGADMLAVITDVFDAVDICQQAKNYQQLFADSYIAVDY